MSENPPGITVTGVGEVTVSPDRMTIDLGVSVRRDTVREATSAAAAAATALIESLRSNGVGDDSVTTTDYSIQPEYDYRNDKQRLLGYRVHNVVKAIIGDVGAAGGIIDSATLAAGDVVTVNGISFTTEDDSEPMAAARHAAWEDAVAKAGQLASLAGRELGPVVSIIETQGRPPMPFARAAMAMADRATPIEPGSATLVVHLDVHFAFAG